MVKKTWCTKCQKDVEEKAVIKHDDHDEIVLACGHTRKHVARSIMEKHISVSDKVTARVIRFETEEDRVNGFYELLLSKSQFRGIDKNMFQVNDEQQKLLDDKHIKYTVVK